MNKKNLNLWITNHYAIPPSYGGLNRHYYFSKELEKYGVKTRIFTSSKIHNAEKNFIKDKSLFLEEEVDGIKYTFIRTKNYRGNGLKRIISFIEFPLNLYRTIRKFYRNEHPDVIYASSPELFSTWVAIVFAKRKGIPVIVEIRDLWPESIVEYSNFKRSNPIIKILYLLEKWIYTKADRLIFTFEGGKDYIRNKKWDSGNGGKIDIGKIRYCNNGVDIKEFASNANDFKVEDEILLSDAFKVIYTGSVRRVNSVYLLVDAAKILQDNGHDDIVFIIYGDGTEKERLIEQCRKDKIKNIYFKERVEKKYIPFILKQADATIFVGEADAMNKYGLSLNKLFDYMAAGKPIISNIETNYDNVRMYNCGIVIPNGRGKEIANTILDIKKLSFNDYNEICNNALSAANSFDYKVLAKKLLDEIIELAE